MKKECNRYLKTVEYPGNLLEYPVNIRNFRNQLNNNMEKLILVTSKIMCLTVLKLVISHNQYIMDNPQIVNKSQI